MIRENETMQQQSRQNADHYTEVIACQNQGGDMLNAVREGLANSAELLTAEQDSLSELDKIFDQTRIAVASLGTRATYINEQASSSMKAVTELDATTSSINQFVAAIQGISEQTNLLALNAAIEAARAGEQGRGFAVVADEVRQLASRTRQSTEEIQNTISLLQQRAVSAAKAMDASRALAENSVSQSAKAGSDLSLIVAHIKHVSDMATHIATAAEEQSVVAEDMNRNVCGINNSALEVSESATYLAQESESLAELSLNLNGKLAVFKL